MLLGGEDEFCNALAWTNRINNSATRLLLQLRIIQALKGRTQSARSRSCVRYATWYPTLTSHAQTSTGNSLPQGSVPHPGGAEYCSLVPSKVFQPARTALSRLRAYAAEAQRWSGVQRMRRREGKEGCPVSNQQQYVQYSPSAMSQYVTSSTPWKRMMSLWRLLAPLPFHIYLRARGYMKSSS